MYEKFYGFTERPFNMTPDSKFFYPSEKHKEALDSLIYSITQRKGFVVITGEIGSGKTTVCRTLLNQLDGRTKVALITNTHLTPKQLISSALEDLEVAFEPGTKSQLLSKLNTFLIEQLSYNCNVVLIVDEAQNLTSTVLEEVRMLANLETEKEKLIQIVLLGQPELRDKLNLKELTQLKQRVSVHYHIYPLTKKETKQYIKHRLAVANSNGWEIFTPQAIDEIYDYSQGVPRLINYICDSALLTGYVNETKTITIDTIREVKKEALNYYPRKE